MITPVARLEVHISNPSALTDLKKAAPARDGLDNRTSGGYTEHEKGAAGRRLAPDQLLKRSNRTLWLEGRLLLFIGHHKEADNAND